VEACIENEDETANRGEVRIIVGWSADKNLDLNVLKTKEPFRLLDTTISNNFNWGANTLHTTRLYINKPMSVLPKTPQKICR